LAQLLNDSVRFVNFEETVLNDLEDISICISNYDSKKYCLMENQEYQPVLLVPTKNLVNPNTENSESYFHRLADEFIRYKRIRLFLLEHKQYLNITDIDYKLNANELILLQSLLEGDYFENMIPFQKNAYVENIPYDLAEPILHQTYPDHITTLQQEDNMENTNDNTEVFVVQCIKETLNEVIGNQKSEWKRIFPSQSREIVLNNSSICTFNLFMYLYQKRMKKAISIETIKVALVTKYNQVLGKHKDNILSILSKQGGKKDMIHRVKTNRISFDVLIKSEEYHLTNLDLWALSSFLDFPILLFSTKPLKNLLLDVNWVILGGNPETHPYFCIRSPSDVLDSGIPNYHLIEPEIRLSDLRENFISKVKNINYVENNLTFETYLEYHHRRISEKNIL